MSISNHVFSAFSFISFILVSIPFPWHLKARNAPTCLYIAWVSLSNLAFFINSVMWDGNVVRKAAIWCDISTRLFLANYVAIPATCLCIQRRIHHVLSHSLATDTPAQSRRMLIWDLLIGLVFPLLNPLFAYFVQLGRFFIYEDIGCRIAFERTALSAVLIPALRLAPGIVSAVYGCLNMYHIWTKRRRLRAVLDSQAGGGRGYDHYIRLFMLSGIDIVITLPFNLWYFVTWFPIIPLPGSNVNPKNRSQIPVATAANWQSSILLVLFIVLPGWMSTIYGFVFFGFFGMSAEARKNYVFAWQYILKIFSKIFRLHTGVSQEPINVHITFDEYQQSAPDSSGSFSGGTIVALSTIDSYPDLKPEGESVFVVSSSEDLKKSSQVSQQYHTTSTPFLSPPNLESEDRAQPPLSEVSKEGIPPV